MNLSKYFKVKVSDSKSELNQVALQLDEMEVPALVDFLDNFNKVVTEEEIRVEDCVISLQNGILIKFSLIIREDNKFVLISDEDSEVETTIKAFPIITYLAS